MGNNIIFLDNASTTKPFLEVNQAVFDAGENLFFNPSALYKDAITVKKEIDLAKKTILNFLKAASGELIFTGSATEANNTVFSSVRFFKGCRIIVSAGEHPSIYEPAKFLKDKGYDVCFAPLTKTGEVDTEAFKNLLNSTTVLVSVVHVNNETGMVNDIKTLVDLTRKVAPKAIFHSDGVQAFGKTDVNLNSLGVDYYTISAHKIHGPKGIGALYVKNKNELKPFILGGGQEDGKRSGTENVPGIIGFKTACDIKFKTRERDYTEIQNLKQHLYNLLKAKLTDKLVLNGDIKNSSPYILSVSFLGVKGEVLLHSLEKHDILVSTGSACSSKKINNRTLASMGKTTAEAEGNIRISFGVNNKNCDLEYVALQIAENVQRLSKFTKK